MAIEGTPASDETDVVDDGPSVAAPSGKERATWEGVTELLQTEGDGDGSTPSVPPSGEDLALWERFAAAEDDASRIEALAPATRAQLAARILASSRIALATRHISGVVDAATVRQNIIDTANGRPARRSAYGTAPGGTVYLDVRMLNAVLVLAQHYSFRISEIAGGSHSATSRHYAGTAVDFDVLNGPPVNRNNPHYRGFMQAGRNLGAVEVLGPGDPDHDTHIHLAWS